MKTNKRVDRKTEILSSNGSVYLGGDEEGESRCIYSIRCRKSRDEKEGSEGPKSFKKRTKFKGSKHVSGVDQPNKVETSKSDVTKTEKHKPEDTKVEHTKVEHAKPSFLAYGYYDPTANLEQEGNDVRLSRKSRRRYGNNLYNTHSLHPLSLGKAGSFMQKIPEYLIYERVHKMSDHNNSFLSTDFRSSDKHVPNRWKTQSQQLDDSYIGEHKFFLSDETRLPTYIASFAGGFTLVIIIVFTFIYLWTKFSYCLGLSKRSPKSSNTFLTFKGDNDEPCMAEKKLSNPNLTKIEDYISGSKAGSFDDDEFDFDYEGEENGFEVDEYHENDEGYNDDQYDDMGERTPDIVDELFESFDKIKKEGIGIFMKNKKKNKSNDMNDEDDDQQPLMEDNEYDLEKGPEVIFNRDHESENYQKNYYYNDYNNYENTNINTNINNMNIENEETNNDKNNKNNSKKNKENKENSKSKNKKNKKNNLVEKVVDEQQPLMEDNVVGENKNGEGNGFEVDYDHENDGSGIQLNKYDTNEFMGFQ